VRYLLNIGIDNKGGLWWGGEWKDYIAPYNSWLYHGIVSKINIFFGHTDTSIESAMFIGFGFLIALILAFYGFFKIKDRKNIIPIVFLFIIFVMITMPVIYLPGNKPFYFPTAILHFIPIINDMRCPTRFVHLVMLLAPVILFWVLENIKPLEHGKVLRNSLAGGLLLLSIVEYKPANYSYVHNKNNLPKIYSILKDKPDGAVLIYPLGVRDGLKQDGLFYEKYLQYQMVFQKKMMGGYFSRVPDWVWYVHYQNAFTNTLLQLEKDTLYKIPDADYTSAIDTLKITYVVIPSEFCHEKAALWLDSIIKPRVQQKEIIEGDILITIGVK
jgi:hypothetical protein